MAFGSSTTTVQRLPVPGLENQITNILNQLSAGIPSAQQLPQLQTNYVGMLPQLLTGARQSLQDQLVNQLSQINRQFSSQPQIAKALQAQAQLGKFGTIGDIAAKQASLLPELQKMQNSALTTQFGLSLLPQMMKQQQFGNLLSLLQAYAPVQQSVYSTGALEG